MIAPLQLGTGFRHSSIGLDHEKNLSSTRVLTLLHSPTVTISGNYRDGPCDDESHIISYIAAFLCFFAFYVVFIHPELVDVIIRYSPPGFLQSP